jgi:light-regulated signal transduction histidine kinase (bacteriophytochrome)
MTDVVSEFEDGIVKTGGEVHWHGLPAVTGSRGQLAVLLRNLVKNALTFVDPSTIPVVDISGTRCDGYWLLTVADNGIGIDPARRDDVFGLFTRLHPRRQYTGSGLGLTACRHIVSRLGGRIWVEGRPEGGSAFSVTLPAGES